MEIVRRGYEAVVPFRLSARGRERGIEAEQHAVQVWTMRNGKALRVEVLASRDEALRAAGLEPDA